MTQVSGNHPQLSHLYAGTTRQVAILFLVLGAVAGLCAQATLPAGSRTVWNGVYTDPQAERARSTFNQVCGNCHTLSAEGNRTLTGDKFWESYAQKSVGDLLSYVSSSMPNGNGGSLQASTYNDLVALILKANGFPAGATELSAPLVADVRIIPKDGPGELPANALARTVGCLSRDGSDWVLTRATVPERADRPGVGPDDASRALGERTIALKFVLSRLDSFVGQRLSVSGLLIGAGGVNGINVTSVNRVAEACP